MELETTLNLRYTKRQNITRKHFFFVIEILLNPIDI